MPAFNTMMFLMGDLSGQDQQFPWPGFWDKKGQNKDNSDKNTEKREKKKAKGKEKTKEIAWEGFFKESCHFVNLDYGILIACMNWL